MTKDNDYQIIIGQYQEELAKLEEEANTFTAVLNNPALILDPSQRTSMQDNLDQIQAEIDEKREQLGEFQQCSAALLIDSVTNASLRDLQLIVSRSLSEMQQSLNSLKNANKDVHLQNDSISKIFTQVDIFSQLVKKTDDFLFKNGGKQLIELYYDQSLNSKLFNKANMEDPKVVEFQKMVKDIKTVLEIGSFSKSDFLKKWFGENDIFKIFHIKVLANQLLKVVTLLKQNHELDASIDLTELEKVEKILENYITNTSLTIDENTYTETIRKLQALKEGYLDEHLEKLEALKKQNETSMQRETELETNIHEASATLGNRGAMEDFIFSRSNIFLDSTARRQLVNDVNQKVADYQQVTLAPDQPEFLEQLNALEATYVRYRELDEKATNFHQWSENLEANPLYLAYYHSTKERLNTYEKNRNLMTNLEDLIEKYEKRLKRDLDGKDHFDKMQYKNVKFFEVRKHLANSSVNEQREVERQAMNDSKERLQHLKDDQVAILQHLKDTEYWMYIEEHEYNRLPGETDIEALDPLNFSVTAMEGKIEAAKSEEKTKLVGLLQTDFIQRLMGITSQQFFDLDIEQQEAMIENVHQSFHDTMQVTNNSLLSKDAIGAYLAYYQEHKGNSLPKMV